LEIQVSGIIAMDVDLHKIYAVHSDGRVLYKAEPDPIAAVKGLQDLWDFDQMDKVLIEVASPVMYIKDVAVIHNVVKWALWNISFAQAASSVLGDAVIVAPSHVWTKGHNLKLRHEVAQCKQKQKDLRECEAMIFYYQQDPESWLTLPKYLANL
jgi:hypothetical protein